MIKGLYISAYMMIGLILAESTPKDPLPIEIWVSFILWVCLMILVATVGIVSFKSVWLQDGFAGINKILEDHEALKFLSAILSFLFLEIFIGLIATTFSGKYPHPTELYYLSMSGCVGSGSVALADKMFAIFKKKSNGNNGA